MCVTTAPDTHTWTHTVAILFLFAVVFISYLYKLMIANELSLASLKDARDNGHTRAGSEGILRMTVLIEEYKCSHMAERWC